MNYGSKSEKRLPILEHYAQARLGTILSLFYNYACVDPTQEEKGTVGSCSLETSNTCLDQATRKPCGWGSTVSYRSISIVDPYPS